jgi:hypothetical protein
MDVKKIIFIVSLALTSFNALSRELTPEEKAAVEITVREEMMDPDAAKFTFAEFPVESSHVYCGLVNGKNAYGAYVGKKLFAVFLIKNDKGEYKALSLNTNKSTGEPSSQDVISATCAGAGYDVKVPSYLVKNVNESRKKNGLPAIGKDLITK